MSIELLRAAQEMERLSVLLDQGLTNLREHAVAYAAAERDYRKAKAVAWVEAPRGEKRGEWTAAERECWVNAATADDRYKRDIVDGLRQAALEAVRSRRQEISAWQSILAADRAEAEFARVGPERAA